MLPQTKDNCWPIEAVAMNIGVDPKVLRESLVRASGGVSVRQGRMVEAYSIERLLDYAASLFKIDKVVLYDRWYENPSSEEVVHALQSGSATQPSETLLEDLAIQKKLELTLAALQQNQFQNTELLAQSLIDLLGIVAVQQQQIVELTRRLDASTVTEVQSRIHEQASDHLHRVLFNSAKALKDTGAAIGSVTAGSVVHKGAITVVRTSSSKELEDSKEGGESRDATKVDVAIEVMGLIRKLAGAGLNLKVDTSKVESRAKELQRKKEVASSESFKGELEIQYNGISVTIGK